jgi:phosphonate transport system substrate-binding protein
MNKRGWVFFILALSFAAGRPVLGDAPRPRTLVIGASAATGQFELYAPIAGYLAEHLKSDGIDQVKIQLCSSIAEASQWLRNGQLDVFFGNSFSSVALQRRVHTQIILRRWRRGSPDYRPVVITRKDAGLHSLADLRGKKIAVKSRFSPVLQYLPRLAHLHLVKVRNLGEPVGSGVVGCIISRSEDNSVYWVLEKKIAAASTDNLQVQHQAKKRNNELQLLYQMDPIPQHLVSVR